MPITQNGQADETSNMLSEASKNKNNEVFDGLIKTVTPKEEYNKIIKENLYTPFEEGQTLVEKFSRIEDAYAKEGLKYKLTFSIWTCNLEIRTGAGNYYIIDGKRSMLYYHDGGKVAIAKEKWFDEKQILGMNIYSYKNKKELSIAEMKAFENDKDDGRGKLNNMISDNYKNYEVDDVEYTYLGNSYTAINTTVNNGYIIHVDLIALPILTK